MKPYSALISLLVMSSCAVIPENAGSKGSSAGIYPDYSGITIPCNIAPMNFMITDRADSYVTVLKSDNGQQASFRGKEVLISAGKWMKLLSNATQLETDIYMKVDGNWLRTEKIVNKIAPEPVDNYLTYRLIEPTYGMAGEMCICQRDLTCFKERTLVNNKLDCDREKGQCMNCHSFRNRSSRDFQFHVRQKDGGTIIVRNGKMKKVNMKADGVLSAGVYPSWHPGENIIAYSVNSTYQNFFSEGVHKTEVIDNNSDIVLYDVDTDRIMPVCTDTSLLETFPYWSSDGKTLFYACAKADSVRRNMKGQITDDFRKVRYNLMQRSFDAATRTFSAPKTIYNADSLGLSATFPRESPDGKYLLFTAGDFGNFHIWHKEADLYLIDLSDGEVRRMENINSEDTESYHSWSSNGRWIVVSSRREDGLYTRFYLAYFASDGTDCKAFLLPQKHPGQNRKLFKSYNIPEFSTDKTVLPKHKLLRTIKAEAIKASLQ